MSSEAGASSSARHRAREVALQTLFAMDLHHRPKRPSNASVSAGMSDEDFLDAPQPIVPVHGDQTVEEVFEQVAEHFEMPHAAQAFAKDLVVQVIANSEAIDQLVSSHAKNWRISRMAVVDRNILRLAAFELVYTKTPAAVVLDEAVELARRFGSDESPPFVNGVLDAVAREVRVDG
jgi:N utilization substance protein B